MLHDRAMDAKPPENKVLERTKIDAAVEALAKRLYWKTETLSPTGDYDWDAPLDVNWQHLSSGDRFYFMHCVRYVLSAKDEVVKASIRCDLPSDDNVGWR